uniref:RRM domain-containing protein n=1 Tax=Trichobilharzia regenti TaxID=157069 RepID=A0AA85J3B3_TRIRE|nr:unnamed protein product [Trichobilharzia regenti]
MTDSDGNEIGKLFIGGLSQATNNGSLRLYFSRFGEIDDAIVMMDNKTGRSRGFGYVKYHECDSVTLALQAKPHIIDGKEVDAKQCNINMKGRNKRSLKIFVGGIGLEQDIESIKDYFKQFGHVTDVNLMMDTNKQRHRGFAFISFDDENVVKRLINLHYVNINNKQVEIKAMEPPNFNRKLINSNLINNSNNSNNHNNNTSTITQNPCSIIPPHIYHLPNHHHTSNSDILNCHDIYESTTNDPAYNFLTNSFTPIYSAHSHPLFSYHHHPSHHHHHQSSATGLQPFLHPNTMRRYYCFDQQNTNTSATSVNTTNTTNSSTSSNTNQFINNYSNFNSNLLPADQPFQSSPFIHQSFRTNPSSLRHPTGKSTTTSTHSPLSNSTVTTTIGTSTSNTTTPIITGNNPFSTMNGTQVTSKQQTYHHQSPMPLILTTNQFQPNLFNFQQSSSSSPSVYTIPCHFIPSHFIPFPSNSMLQQQSTLMNAHSGLICNDVFNTTNNTTVSSSATTSTVTDTTNTSNCTTFNNSNNNKKVVTNSSTEEQIISNDSLSRMTPVTIASKNMNASSTSGNNGTNAAGTPSLVATSTATTLNETIDTTDNNVSNNAVPPKSIDDDNFGILNNVQGGSITGEHIAFCAPNYNHLNYASNSLQSTNLPLTPYYALCSQYPTGVSNTPTGTSNLQVPINDNYNVGQIINNVNSNPSISVTNQGDNPLTNNDNQSLTNDVLLVDQKLNTTKCFCHPTIFIPNGIHTQTQSINQTPNLWNTPGNISSSGLFHSTFQPLTGWNFPLGSHIISPPFTHQTSHYHPYIPENQMTLHQNDMLNQWNQLPSTYNGNNITKSTSNDIDGSDLKDSITATAISSSSSLLSSSVSSLSSFSSSSTSTTLSPSLTTMHTVTGTTKTESTEVPTTTIIINSTTKSISSTSSIPTSDDVMTLNTGPKCNNKDIYLNDTMQNNFNRIMSAKPSGDNLEGLLVNNNNINQCINDNIFCFIKSPITDLTSTLIEPENNEVTKSWQNNNNNNLWTMPKVENLSQTLPHSSKLTTGTTTLNYPTSPQMIIQPIYNSYHHLSNEYVNGFLSNCDTQSGVNLNLTDGRESFSNVENNLNKLKLMNDNTVYLLSNNSMKTIINDNVKLPKKAVSEDNEKSSSPILSDLNENSSLTSLPPKEKTSAIPEKVEMTEKMSTSEDLSTNNIRGIGLNKNVIIGEECVDKTEQLHTKQFQNNNTDSISTHLPPNENEHEIDRGNISCIDKTYKEYECRSNTGATGDYPPNHHFVKNNYHHLL